MEKKSIKYIVAMIVLIVILGGGLIIMLARYNKMKAESEMARETLEDQKQSLSKELKDMNVEYDALKTDNDSMNHKIEDQQKKIKGLLSIQASNIDKIKIYKKELGTLRDIMKSYIVQIDSLNRRNQVLVEENQDVKTKLSDARTKNETLSQEKEDLSSKVNLASTLSAKNITTLALNKRGKETEKVSKVTKLKVCFTIRENSIAKAGTKTIYIRLTRPDNLVLATSEQNTFDYENQNLVYSEKRDVEYENKDVDMCIFWDNQNNLITGIYSVDLFTDGKLIGSSTFTLK
jgi:FtsZ-binding cell division protein ZapB